MKAASGALIAFLSSNSNFYKAELWTLVTKSGYTVRFTTADRSVTYGGNTYPCNQLVVGGASQKLVKGLEVDTMEVTLTPTDSGNLNFNGVPFLQAVGQGVLSRALVTRDLLIMPTWGDTSLGTVRLFTGEMGEIIASEITADAKINSLLNLLNVNMPKRLVQSSCPYTFGGAECGINRASYTKSSTATTGSTATTILCSIADAFYTYNFGVLKFTSGINSGISRTVKAWSPNCAVLTAPFPNAPAVGDAFTISAGCSKALSTNNVAPCLASNGNVGAVSSTTTTLLTDTGAGFPVGYYVVFRSGANNGQYRQITSSSTGIITVASAFPSTPANGDFFSIRQRPTVNYQIATGYIRNLAATQTIPTNISRQNGYYNGAVANFLTGANAGQSSTISQWINNTMTLSSALPFACAQNDQIYVAPPTGLPTASGQTCAGYGNAARFGGQPYVPVPESAV